MDALEHGWEQVADQAEAYERTRIDLARVSFAVNAANFDELVNGLKIESDVRELTQMIRNLDREFIDDQPALAFPLLIYIKQHLSICFRTLFRLFKRFYLYLANQHSGFRLFRLLKPQLLRN